LSTATPASAPARPAVDQLIIDQTHAWRATYDSARVEIERVSDIARDPSLRGQLARALAARAVDAWSVLYLLTLLRDVDPGVADRAARYLNHDAASLTPWMCERLVTRWRTAAENGDEVTVPLAP
jgi:hypothetical protein